jgi:hypothetical protein
MYHIKIKIENNSFAKNSTCGLNLNINWHKMKKTKKSIKTFIIISMNFFNECVCVKFIPCSISISKENHLKMCALENKN